jgi:integrase
MKMRIEHTVPLPRQVVKLFRELRGKQAALWGDCELCFPSPRARSRPITSESLMCALKAIHGLPNITVHGFRTSFSTLAREKGFNPDHVEKQLAHQLKDAVEAAYNRAEYLEPRRKMMQKWANYLDSLR